MTIINNNLINPNLVNKVKKTESIVNNKVSNTNNKTFKEIFENKTENANILFSKHASMRLNNNKTFKEIFENKTENSNILFSKHAYMRLNSRNLQLSNAQIKRVEDGIKRAEEKGIRDSLVLVDNIALLVNIKNKTVVTAIDNNSEKVYTNIDGAVIV